MVKKFITVSELANVIGISRQAVLKQLKGKINSGDIETRTEGKTYLIKFSSLPKDIKNRYENSQKEAVEQAKELVGKPQKDLNFEKDL